MLRSITVLGPPIPQGSKRHVGRGIFIEANKKLPRYREDIVDTIIEDGWHTDPILAGPVSVKIGFYLPRPKTHYGTGKNAGVLKDNAPDLPRQAQRHRQAVPRRARRDHHRRGMA